MGDEPPSGTHPGRWRLVGALAAVALAASSWGSGSRPELHTRVLWPGLSPAAETGGSPLLATVSVLAMAVLVLSWWRLRQAVVVVRWWWLTAAAWFVPLVASMPLYSRDLYSYAAQGALWHEGLNPYEHGVRDLESEWKNSTAPTWLETPTPYGPVFLLLARGVAALSGEQLGVALVLLRLVAVVGVVAIAWAVADIARRLGVDGVRATWLGVACPLVGAHFVSGAHNDALMVAGVLLGIALALRGRFALAVLAVALAAMVKVTAVIALPFIALLWARSAAHRRTVGSVGSLGGVGDQTGSPTGMLTWGAVVGAGLRTIVIAAIPMALLGLATGLGFAWLNPAATPGRNEQWTSLPTGIGMAVGAVGHVLGRDDWRDTGIAAARAAGLVVMLVVLVLIWLTAAKPGPEHDREGADHVRPGRRPDRLRVVGATGWAMLTVVVLAPAFLGWYFLWALPVLAASVAAAPGRLQTALAAVASVLCFATLPDGYSLGLTTTAVGVPVALVATGLLVRQAVRWARRADWRHSLDLARPMEHNKVISGPGPV
jgi:alpha-1,6-mannosyltransferase